MKKWIENIVMRLVKTVYGENVQVLGPLAVNAIEQQAATAALKGQPNADTLVRDAKTIAASDAQRDTLEAIDMAFSLAGADMSVEKLAAIIDGKASGVETELGALQEQLQQIEDSVEAKTDELMKYGELLAKLR